MSSVITGGSNTPRDKDPTWEELVLESRRVKRRNNSTPSERTLSGYGRCTHCGKLNYNSRKAAKAYARRRSLVGLSAYRCQHSKVEVWHLGHLPDYVRSGDAPREMIRTAKLRGDIGEKKRILAPRRTRATEQ